MIVAAGKDLRRMVQMWLALMGKVKAAATVTGTNYCAMAAWRPDSSPLRQRHICRRGAEESSWRVSVHDNTACPILLGRAGLKKHGESHVISRIYKTLPGFDVPPGWLNTHPVAVHDKILLSVSS